MPLGRKPDSLAPKGRDAKGFRKLNRIHPSARREPVKFSRQRAHEGCVGLTRYLAILGRQFCLCPVSPQVLFQKAGSLAALVMGEGRLERPKCDVAGSFMWYCSVVGLLYAIVSTGQAHGDFWGCSTPQGHHRCGLDFCRSAAPAPAHMPISIRTRKPSSPSHGRSWHGWAHHFGILPISVCIAVCGPGIAFRRRPCWPGLLPSRTSLGCYVEIAPGWECSALRSASWPVTLSAAPRLGFRACCLSVPWATISRELRGPGIRWQATCITSRERPELATRLAERLDDVADLTIITSERCIVIWASHEGTNTPPARSGLESPAWIADPWQMTGSMSGGIDLSRSLSLSRFLEYNKMETSPSWWIESIESCPPSTPSLRPY